MSELPPVPDAEFSPPWHQFIVTLKTCISDFITATNARLGVVEAAIETPDIEGGHLYPLGCVCSFNFVNEENLIAGINHVYTGDRLRNQRIFGEKTDTTTGYVNASIVGVGTWKMTGTISENLIVKTTFSNLPAMNFIRIS